jgi:hypothetical protein
MSSITNAASNLNNNNNINNTNIFAGSARQPLTNTSQNLNPAENGQA